MKKAFTLAEAILTMTILGVLSAVMVTTLKPGQYKEQAFKTLRQKAYNTVDQATQSILSDCVTNAATGLASIHNNCNLESATHAFSAANEVLIYKMFLRGQNAAVSAAATGCDAKTDYSNLKLRNGTCLYFKTVSDGIFVDVNGKEGPNVSGTDQFTISLENVEGVSSDLP